VLEALPGHRTRLLVSGYAASNPRVLIAIGNFVFWEPAHWIMQIRQFTNLKRRVGFSARGRGFARIRAGLRLNTLQA
jgi:hypothetical protein